MDKSHKYELKNEATKAYFLYIPLTKMERVQRKLMQGARTQM